MTALIAIVAILIIAAAVAYAQVVLNNQFPRKGHSHKSYFQDERR